MIRTILVTGSAMTPRYVLEDKVCPTTSVGGARPLVFLPVTAGSFRVGPPPLTPLRNNGLALTAAVPGIVDVQHFVR